MKKQAISMNVVRRLPKYLRCISELLEEKIFRISSKQLGELTGFTSSQIRQDFNHFGGFGKQGYGYDVQALYGEICEILAIKKRRNAIIIGAGNLGQAIANYSGFREYFLDIKAIFDIDENIIGKPCCDLVIKDQQYIDSTIDEENISIAIICTPKEVASEIAQKLMNCPSIHGIWNFAPVDIKGNDKVFVENVSLVDSLYVLSFMMKQKRNK